MFFYFFALLIFGIFGFLFTALLNPHSPYEDKKDYDKRLDNQLNDCRKL